MLGEGAQESAEAHDPRQCRRGQEEDAQQIFKHVPEKRSTHAEGRCYRGRGAGSMLGVRATPWRSAAEPQDSWPRLKGSRSMATKERKRHKNKSIACVAVLCFSRFSW